MSEVIHPVERFKVSKLTKHPNNPRILRDAQYQTLKKSIDDNPDLLEARPLILSNRTGKNIVIGGNQRLQVVKDLGWLTVPCVMFPDLTEEKEREIMIRDNVSNGDWDFDKLKADWDSTELNEWGLDVPWGDAEPDQVVGQTDADETPEVQPVPVSVTGDLWVLGDHRLLCGDSTDADQVAALMNGEKADMVFTDPPYGMHLNADYSSAKGNPEMNKKKSLNGGNVYKKVIGDHDDFSPELINSILSFFSYCQEIFLWGADYYSELILDKNNGSWIVWDKRIEESTDKIYGSSFELCWSKSKHKRSIARIKWAGVFGVEQEHDKCRSHPTQKPTALAEWFFEKWGQDKKIISDLYGGSGSTMIACEKTGRHCRMMELDQNYCDVIVRRWQDFTGRQAILESTGQTFEEVKNERIS